MIICEEKDKPGIGKKQCRSSRSNMQKIGIVFLFLPKLTNPWINFFLVWFRIFSQNYKKINKSKENRNCQIAVFLLPDKYLHS